MSMLGTNDAIATIAVKDLQRAATFYRDTLGLEPLDTEQRGVSRYASGRSTVLVYQSQFAGTNRATSATWQVDNVKELARTLRGRGITFEHYDLPGLTREGDVYVAERYQGAWFKDPDGNILHIVSG
jgi:catechol 2,3-dioxygenase-like lactoylglutathione lyase family enzyme